MYALLDTGSSFSYVTPLIAVNFEMSPEIIPEPILVYTPVGDSIIAQKVYKKCPVTVLHRVLLADLIELDMVDFDVILGMDWLYSSYASIDCRTRVVKFQFSGASVFEWSGNSVSPKSHFISYLKARKLISKGCIYHLVRVKDTKSETPTLQSVNIANEFSYVFSDDLPGIPPDREIEFGIDLLPILSPFLFVLTVWPLQNLRS